MYLSQVVVLVEFSQYLTLTGCESKQLVWEARGESGRNWESDTSQQRRVVALTIPQMDTIRTEVLAPRGSQLKLWNPESWFYSTPLLVDETSKEKGMQSSRQAKPDIQESRERPQEGGISVVIRKGNRLCGGWKSKCVDQGTRNLRDSCHGGPEEVIMKILGQTILGWYYI